MRLLASPFLLVVSCTTLSLQPAEFDSPRLRDIDQAIERAIAQQKLPGGVFHLERQGTVYEKAYGSRSLVPTVEPMTTDTIFDAASITKVVATTPSVWLLIQRGLVELDAPVQRYIPEFHGGWRDEITVRHLLTHTSGLRPDLDLTSTWSGYKTAIAMASSEEVLNRPGYVFRYSDINFELLGEIVHRISGQPLDVFAGREIFQPLGMKDTGFRPFAVTESGAAGAGVDPRRGTGFSPSPPVLLGANFSSVATGNPARADTGRIAPTEFAGEVMLRGVVHDPTARRMGGVAGHAGLFTTVGDLARYSRMLLAGGGRVLRPETVNMMTTVQSPPNVAVRRAGGFDLDSGFARPRGDVFAIGSYGHTGFTGGWMWIDPYSRTFYVFLSNRVHPSGKGNVLALQRTLGTLAARAVRGFDFAHVAGALPPREGSAVSFTEGGAATSNGIDVLNAKRYEPLRGMRIGLITNHTGIDRAGNPTIDLLRSAPGVTVVALFSPEHGIRGTVDAKFPDSIDPVSGLPVHSLYGQSLKPAPEQLAGLEALVFDVQDIGARFYTYVSTMSEAMEAAAAAHVKFIVLDRVNPIGGLEVEGPIAKGAISRVAWHPVPIRHGMTMGELARMINAERQLDADLTVVPLQSWTRDLWHDDTGLPWINPSPNMRSLAEAALYPGIGILERSISVGRSTATPFELAGAPYIDADALSLALTSLGLPGVRFEPAHFVPTASVFKGKGCNGVRFLLTDRKSFKPVATGIAVASVLQRLYPKDFELDKCDLLLRDSRTLDAIRAEKPLDEIVAMWTEDENGFRERRAKYLLYP